MTLPVRAMPLYHDRTGGATLYHVIEPAAASAPPPSLPPMRTNPLPALGLGRPVGAPGGDEEQGGGGNAFAGIVGQRSLLARMQKNSRPGGSAGYT